MIDPHGESFVFFGKQAGGQLMVNCLTWPMAKRLKLFGITYSIGKISRSNFYFRVHWLSKLLVWVLVVWIPGIPENERDWDPWVYP